MEIKEIKTVVSEEPDAFDLCVNKLLRYGYNLVRRRPERVGPNAWKLYAELVKLDQDDMEELETDTCTWKGAVNVLRGICETAEKCDADGCPMFAWCQENLTYSLPPCKWKDTEE